MSHTPPVPSANTSPYPLHEPPHPHASSLPPVVKSSDRPAAESGPSSTLIGAAIGLGITALAGAIYFLASDRGAGKSKPRKRDGRAKHR